MALIITVGLCTRCSSTYLRIAALSLKQEIDSIVIGCPGSDVNILTSQNGGFIYEWSPVILPRGRRQVYSIVDEKAADLNRTPISGPHSRNKRKAYTTKAAAAQALRSCSTGRSFELTSSHRTNSPTDPSNKRCSLSLSCDFRRVADL